MLKQRTQNFIDEIGLPVSRLAYNVNLNPDTVRRWLKGEMKLKDTTEQRIDLFLRKFNR